MLLKGRTNARNVFYRGASHESTNHPSKYRDFPYPGSVSTDGFRSSTDRRPIAGIFRRTADAAVRFCVARRISPDTISYASSGAAVLAALCFVWAFSTPVLWLVGAAFCALRLWLNMLDGMVAIASERCTEWGKVANELPDRVSDVAIFAGLAWSGACYGSLALWTAIGALAVAYVGTLSQAVGAGRRFEGVMSKPYRMAAVMFGALWTALVAVFPATEMSLVFGLIPFQPMDLALIVTLAGCLWTCVERLDHMRARLSAA